MSSWDNGAAQRLPLRIVAYCLSFALALGLVSSGLFVLKEQSRWAPDPAGDLPGKTAYFLAHARDYDLVFLGDSRTYCAFHPEILDPLLGTRSFNLSHWAHWLPTQYAHLQDVLPALEPGTTLVWSLGEENFQNSIIQDKYPLGIPNAWRLLRQGYSPGELAENVLTFLPPTFLYTYRGVLLGRSLAGLSSPLWSAMADASPAPGGPAAVQAPARPGVLRSEVQAPEGRPVAVSLFMQGGGYMLEELDPAHFRVRQTPGGRAAGDFKTRVYTAEPSRWATFLIMLDLCRERGVRLVVNVMEEAPQQYASRDVLLWTRAFMDGPVRREVEARGFVFLRADMDQLTSADYFDYNHLNSRGVEKYSRLFAAALAPHLKQLRGQ